ncbi:flagellar filament capping protein FliD [Noviherbaspirillum saxi]|uniref:Flagellar hook-associated protein 2 n=1 Tax=Noviherbaspirillum saxi TaxID=2320863 RepID=A0A3A3FWR8_9BURK|nr:flagellar filament capping protein FliD [Noviherbaspirillum saxi]RJF98611.1 flagellar hook protein FliD [Noviherbaspirillum saxi]
MAMSSAGVGANLDVAGLVSKLMAVESQPLTTLQKKEASYQAKLTAYGSLKGALSSFQSSISGLSDVSKFQSLTASASDSSILSASSTSAASPGNYTVSVSALAQSQTISSAGQASTTAAIGGAGTTTLTFQFGTISGGSLASGTYTGASFAQDATQATGSVVINNSNNSLQGIRDAINSAGVGVTASIVNDGNPTTPYRLLITSNSTGLSKSMKITSDGGDASISSLLSYDPAGTQNLTQTSAAQNAALSVNGLAISSASNSVTGAISGVTLNLTKAGSTNLSIANNTSAIASALQSLVQSYNSINTTLNTLTRYNATTKQGGLLMGDASMQMIQSRIRSTLSGALSGLGSNTLTNLSQVGLSFLKDGTLSLDNAKLQSALSSNFGDFASLFASFGKATDSLTSYVSATGNTKAGSYAVEVTTLATQGKVTGSAPATQARLTGSAAADLTVTAGVNDKLLVSVDGGSAISVTLTPGAPYANADALAAQVQADINTALTAASQTGQVTVTQSAGRLSITSNAFGSASAVSVTDDGGFPGNTGATSLLGGAPTTSSVATIKTGVNDQLSLGVNGTTATITLAAGTYTASTLAALIQSTANAATSFTSAGIAVTVSESAGVLTVNSNRYGVSSAVSIAGGSGAANLFGASPSATIGADIVGKINGVAATGSGQLLTGATGNDAEGLRVQVVGGIPGARGTVNFSKGYAYNLNKLLDDVLSSTGSIANSTTSVNNNIADLQKRATALNVQLAATEKRYMAQFTSLDTLISKMNATSSFLTQQLANLPKIEG